MKWRAVRCILRSNTSYLLAVHNNYIPENVGKWGLPGGHIEAGKTFEVTANREMYEEFGLSLDGWLQVGDYPCRGTYQKVLGTMYEGAKALYFDRAEILEAAWFTLDDVRQLSAGEKLHTGFELEAILTFSNLQNPTRSKEPAPFTKQSLDI